MVELTLNTFKKDNFIFIDKESGFAVTRLNCRGVVSNITPSLQRAIDSGTLIMTKDFRIEQEKAEEKAIIDSKEEIIEIEEEINKVEEEVKTTKRKPRAKK